MKAHDAQKGKRCSSIACLDKARQDLHRQVFYERVGSGEREMRLRRRLHVRVVDEDGECGGLR